MPRVHRARMGKKRRRAARLDDAADALEEVIEALRQKVGALVLDDVPDTTELCKLAHALGQAASSLARTVSAGEMEERLRELEAMAGLAAA